LWKRSGSNPETWDTKPCALPTALRARYYYVIYTIIYYCIGIVANSEPDEAVLKKLVGWRQPLNHPMACLCSQCAIPKGTCLRLAAAVTVTAGHSSGFGTSAWLLCGTRERLGTRPRRTRRPRAPGAGVQLEVHDSDLLGTGIDGPTRMPPGSPQSTRREAPTRGGSCSVSPRGPGACTCCTCPLPTHLH
jgi:hypothetical protein